MLLEHPYGELAAGEWVCGNLHAHTTRSDGRLDPQAVIDEYAGRGHGFLMFSDHDKHADAAVYAELDAKGLIMLPGSEITANGPHMLHVGATQTVEAAADRQAAIDAANRAGGFVVLNHPNWLEKFDHIPLELMMKWTGYAGLEIYNGVICRWAGSPYALDKWDMLLSAGKRVWGFANDDSHRPVSDYGLGWNCVYVKEKTPQAILAALQAGRFYASTGVRIEEIAVSGNRIRVSTSNGERIVAVQKHGKRLAQADARELEVEVPEDAGYVRFQCWGRGESFAWTQPFHVTL